MTAARSVPPPDMSGLTDDWERLRTLRRNSEDGSGDEAGPEDQDQAPGPAPTPKPRAGRTRGGRRRPPAAADAVPTTIRFDPEEARAITRFILDLSDETGRRQLDKAEVFRELIRLAMEHDPTRRALLRRIRN